MFDIIAGPMGAVLKFIYDHIAFQNYGIAIILFTVVIKSLMLPLTHKAGSIDLKNGTCFSRRCRKFKRSIKTTRKSKARN